MFVSSYTTYINPSVSEKNTKEKLDAAQESFSRYESKSSILEKKVPQNLVTQNKQLPLDYISNYKVVNNQQRLLKESEASAGEKSKFTKISTLQKAQDAYVQNSSFFTLLKKPKATIDQTPHFDLSTPSELRDAQRNILKSKMLNTYIANDNYYKITA